MSIDLTEDGNVEIDMKDYLAEAINAYGEEIKGTSPTPAKVDLFKSEQNSKGLSEDKSERFHHIVAKLLYISKRARPDIDLMVSYLYTRV